MLPTPNTFSAPETTRQYTYAQVAASPPTTPRQTMRQLSRDAPAPAESLTARTGGGVQTKTARPETTAPKKQSVTARAEPAIPTTTQQQREDEAQESTPATPGPSTQQAHPTVADELSDIPPLLEGQYSLGNWETNEYEEWPCLPRRYGTPTSEDWRNLSVHGSGSVASDDYAATIGDTVYRDEKDIECFVTDGVDRFGNTIPGQETIREEHNARKRQRPNTPPQGTRAGREFSVRFRHHRPQPPTRTDTPHPTRSNRSLVTNDEQTTRTGSEPAANTGTWLRSTLPTASPPRASAAEKGKAIERAAHRQAAAEHMETAAPLEDVPWNALTVDMDVDEGDMPHATDGNRQATPTPSQRPLSGDMFIARRTKAQAAPEHNGNRSTSQAAGHTPVEVLPSFLAPPPATRTENLSGRWSHGQTERATPHLTPVTPGSDGYGFTPTPDSGFPTVHQPHPEGLIEDLAIMRIDEAWKCEEGSILFVQVANIGYPDSYLRKTLHDEIHGVLRHVTGESGFVPIAPQPEWVRPPARTGAPKTWIVRGLPKTQVANLARMHVLSCAWITLFMYERKLVIPRYLFTLTGYTTNHNNDVVDSVKGAFASEPILATITDLVQSHPTLCLLPPDVAASHIIDSVEVRIDQLSNGNMQAAVFCDPPTGCGESWKIWRTELMKMPFYSQFNPVATARRIELCLVCHSADHVSHKCPFPHIQGWNAPPVKTRSFGRPRPPQTADGETMPPTQATPTPTYRGRGRGTGVYRGARSMTPARNQYYSGQMS